jgi:hypothetical protein
MGMDMALWKGMNSKLGGAGVIKTLVTGIRKFPNDEMVD